MNPSIIDEHYDALLTKAPKSAPLLWYRQPISLNISARTITFASGCLQHCPISPKTSSNLIIGDLLLFSTLCNNYCYF